MAKSLEWYQNIFANISIDVDRVKHLEELQIALSTTTAPNLLSYVTNLQLGIIFDCLNTSDKIQIELTINVLKKLLLVLDPCDVIKLYGVHLGRALEHPEIEAKKLVINELSRTSKNHNLLALMCNEVPLLLSVVDCIKSEDLSLATVATNFLNELGKVPAGVDVLFSQILLNSIKETAKTSDVVRFRIYDIIVSISVNSLNGLTAAEGSGLLIDLLNELQSGDVLLQLTSLETVTKLALSDHGLIFLFKKKVLTYLEEILNDPSVINSLLLPGIIKFFGNVAHTNPEVIFTQYPRVLKLIFQLHDSNDAVLSNVSLETIGFISSSSNPLGKQILKQYDREMINVLDMIGKMIALQPSERKVVALNVLTNLLHLNIPDQTPELLLITKNWFFRISENPTKTLMNVCEKPFMELKLAGLVALNAIAVQPWGQEEIMKCPGLIEYLLDRNEESDMNCKAAKYNLIKAIIQSPFAKNIFNSDILGKLQLYVRQGICYAETKTEIALEAV